MEKRDAMIWDLGGMESPSLPQAARSTRSLLSSFFCFQICVGITYKGRMRIFKKTHQNRGPTASGVC